MNDLLDVLIELLPEFDLPEPEAPYLLKVDGQEVKLLMAFIDKQLGIREGHSQEVEQFGDWRIWECNDEERARIVFTVIAKEFGIEPTVMRLNFSRIDMLIDAGQFDSAKSELEVLQEKVDQGHPDWDECERRRKMVRQMRRKITQGGEVETQAEIPKISFVELLRHDAVRASVVDFPEFNIMGLFSPDDESKSTVDAVWVAHVTKEGVAVWAACLEGNPAYEQDPNWEIAGSEVEMFHTLLEKLQPCTTFLWGASKTIHLLQSWHRRALGEPLPEELTFIDLQALCQVAFPMAHRTDMPESLCKQIPFQFCDEMGIGGPLAAMTALITRCRETLQSLADVPRTTIRTVLSFGLNRPYAGDLFESARTKYTWSVIPKTWLDIFLPADRVAGFEGFLTLLAKHYESLPLPLKKSEGDRNPHRMDVISFFKKGGFLSQAAELDYRERPDQIGFSQRVDESLTESIPYLLEAGTGIGKTVGYLIPVLLSGKKAFVSTYTKTLQDQAWSKDVPMVLKALSLVGIERTVSIIKGKSNYACLQTVADWLDDLREVLHSPEDVCFLAAVLHWLLLSETGWLSEIEHLGNWRLLNHLGRDQAPPKLQELWAEIDPLARARDAASKADLVIANHSYVFALANASDTSKNDVDILVLDEAHNIDDVVTEVLTLHFSPWVLKYELDSLLKRDEKGNFQGMYRALIYHPQIDKHDELKRFSARLGTFEKSLDGWCHIARERLCDMFCNIRDFDPDLPVQFSLDEFWVTPLYESAKNLYETFGALGNAVHQLLDQLSTIKGLPKRIAGSLASLEKHLNDNAEALHNLFETREDTVHWAEASVRVDEHGKLAEEGGFTAWIAELHSTPLDIAGWLKEHLNSLYKHRIYVSATLTVGGDFSTIIGRFGLEGEDEKQKPVTGIYPSPFDYTRQTLLGVPHDMRIADSRLRVDPLYIEQQSQVIADLATISDGKTLVLFTSQLIMREMVPRLQSRLQSKGILVLSQADASRSALIDRLRDAPRKGEKMVLLGLRAFWEGIDIAGEALSILVVSRLPFDYHGHPVFIAKKRYYESKGFDRDYFRERVVPNVFLNLRQMYGRLIRTETDRGATVITDPRIYVKRYGRQLLQRLPESTTVVDKSPVVVEAVGKFLRGEEVSSSFVWGELPLATLELSPEQRAIVECPSKRVLVRAAAGSGKTHVLITRLIRFVDMGKAKPEEILALTFTNKAMEVIYGRLEFSLGGEKAYQMHNNVLTYHRLAMRIIRQDDRETGRDTGFIDENNPELQDELFTRAREESGLSETVLNNEDARTLISYAQSGLVNESELESKIADWQTTEPILAKFAKFFLAYLRLLREKNLIDYGEAIVKAVHILRNPDQAKRWSNRFKWIFCDEYQDTSPAQATLLQLLGQQANLFVVGDNAQSIYSWQGSDPDNLRRFELDFQNTATFNLSKNYRCFPKLVRMSSRFLDRCGQTYGIRMEYDQKRSTEDQNVYFLHNDNDREEGKAIAKLVKEGLELQIPGDPPPHATVGVLARKWHLLESIEAELIKQGIPYGFEGETARGIIANPTVKQIVTRAVDLYTQSTGEQQFGDTAEGKIVQKLRNNNITKASELLENVRLSMPGEELGGEGARNFRRLCAILNDQPTGILKQLFGREDNEKRVVLSTVHSQKGEEFDTVIVIGLEEGNSPHEPPKSHQRLVEWRRAVQGMSHATWRVPLPDVDMQRLYEEEEKRIFYVAMTRAKYNLIVSRAKTRNLFGRTKPYEKSNFLDLAHDAGFVCETSSVYDVSLTTPPTRTSDDEGYRSDGRVFQTNSGTLVRSKSEMLLANEFTARGMYFEYEEPADGVVDALPDFMFPDYGNIILEHLGLLTDPNYLERWEQKANEYEKKGIRYFRTNEEEIKTLPATVDRLQEQFCDCVQKVFGEERANMISKVEKLRRESGFQIGRTIGDFMNGVFEVDDKEGNVIAIAIAIAITDDIEKIKDMSIPGYLNINWEQTVIAGMDVCMARCQNE